MKSLDSLRAQIRGFGTNSDPEIIMAGAELLTPWHEIEPYDGITVTRDVAYGPHERHRLDLYQPLKQSADALPVLIFIHGGGFVAGDKNRPNSPYNDHVGVWAARHGMAGVVINYRLAPEFQYPCGAEDVNSVLSWLRDNVGQYGGDPEKIAALGTSAGANHLATCIALPELLHSVNLKAAILMSCIYDITQAERNDFLLSYFGDDDNTYERKSNLNGVLESKIPLLVTLAEFEPRDFENQSLLFIKKYFEQYNRWPNFYRIMGHNHFTSSQHINTADDAFTKQLLDFIQQHLAT